MKQSQPCSSDGYRGCCSNTAPSEMRSLCGYKDISFSIICWLQARSRDCQAKTKLLWGSPTHAIKVEGSPQASACLHWAPELFFLAVCSTDPQGALDQTSLSAPCSVGSMDSLSRQSPGSISWRSIYPGEELNGHNVYSAHLPVSALKGNLTISLFQHRCRPYCFEFHVLCQLGSLWFVCSFTPHATLLDWLAQFLLVT